jgi:transposase
MLRTFEDRASAVGLYHENGMLFVTDDGFAPIVPEFADKALFKVIRDGRRAERKQEGSNNRAKAEEKYMKSLAHYDDTLRDLAEKHAALIVGRCDVVCFGAPEDGVIGKDAASELIWLYFVESVIRRTKKEGKIAAPVIFEESPTLICSGCGRRLPPASVTGLPGWQTPVRCPCGLSVPSGQNAALVIRNEVARATEKGGDAEDTRKSRGGRGPAEVISFADEARKRKKDKD